MQMLAQIIYALSTVVKKAKADDVDMCEVSCSRRIVGEETDPGDEGRLPGLHLRQQLLSLALHVPQPLLIVTLDPLYRLGLKRREDRIELSTRGKSCQFTFTFVSILLVIL